MDEIRLESELHAQISKGNINNVMTQVSGRGSGSGWNNTSSGATNASGLDASSYNLLNEFLESLIQIGNELLITSINNNNYATTKISQQENDDGKDFAPSPPPSILLPGAMEIRLPESSIDDETLHSVIGISI